MNLFIRYTALLLCFATTPVLALEDQYLDANGVKIRYIDTGRGKAIVLLHGGASNLESWTSEGVVDNLAKDFRVIAFDARGHGKSDSPRDPAAYGRQQALDVVRILDALKIQRAHIIGFSLGSSTVAQLLTLHPERFLTGVQVGGAGPAVSDVLGGQVPFIFVAIPSIVQHVKSGKLRPLAVTGTHRSQALPDVPTFAETLPGFEAVGWNGVLAPAGTSPEIVARLHSKIRKITATPEVRAAWSAQVIEMLGGSPSEFSDYMKSELKKWTQVIKSSGAKAD